MTNTVPIWEKANLSLEEATAYYGIEEDTLSQIISVEECQPYILTIGNKQLIRRKAFEKYLSETYSAGTCHNEDAVLESAAQDLDNCMTEPDYTLSDGVEYMATKINRTVTIHGERKWIHANTEQEYADKLAKLFGADGSIEAKHNFKEYAANWFEVYSKPTIEKATAATYQRQLTLHLNPFFGDSAIEDISVDDVQRFFNSMTGAKATKDKAKQVLNMVLETALDEGLIKRNPLKSKRVKITGAASTYTKVYTVDQTKYLIRNIELVKNPVDRAYLAIQAMHPLRLEEVLGLKWCDVDTENLTLHICRAVTHPTRNQPEIKDTQTDASRRIISLSQIAASHLSPGNEDDFIFGGAKPYSYQQVKRMCERIRSDTGFDDKITPIRFRTTVLTDIYEATKDVKAAQAAAGHTTPAMTMKRYVKGRGTTSQTAAAIDQLYGS